MTVFAELKFGDAYGAKAPQHDDKEAAPEALLCTPKESVDRLTRLPCGKACDDRLYFYPCRARRDDIIILREVTRSIP